MANNPNGDKIATTILVPMEAVQLCIANSKRLLNDADYVSEPTRAALIEIAFEEVLKAWILFFNLNDTTRWPKADPNVGKGALESADKKTQAETIAELKKLVEEGLKIIPSNQALPSIFRGPGAHLKKLQTFEYVIKYCKTSLRLLSAGLDLGKSLESMGFGFIKFPEAGRVVREETQ